MLVLNLPHKMNWLNMLSHEILVSTIRGKI